MPPRRAQRQPQRLRQLHCASSPTSVLVELVALFLLLRAAFFFRGFLGRRRSGVLALLLCRRCIPIDSRLLRRQGRHRDAGDLDLVAHYPAWLQPTGACRLTWGGFGGHTWCSHASSKPKSKEIQL
ncbi:hypothetical protein OAO87_00480 [bacterium]|nr:hypothetical protein [bacterium]